MTDEGDPGDDDLRDEDPGDGDLAGVAPFICPKRSHFVWRRLRFVADPAEDHVVTPLEGRRGGDKTSRLSGARFPSSSREYRCSCGHHGWGSGPALDRLEQDQQGD